MITALLTREQADAVLAAVADAWGDSSDVERDPAALGDRIAAAVLAMVAPGPCRHERTVTTAPLLSDPDGVDVETCADCGEESFAEPCGICNDRWCKCNEYGLR